MPFNLSFKPL
ncbi:uncharacterized protein FFM5_15325 [Fusarium fujikuroi]|nr:uncharacterized protein FFM5_15325 [Fusarium fujikuroi]